MFFFGPNPSSANTLLTIVTRCEQVLKYETFYARLSGVAIYVIHLFTRVNGENGALAEITGLFGDKRWVNCGPKQMPVPETTSCCLLRTSSSVISDTQQKV